jgi:glycosyltransferase involved in cell wall biosynthesis
MSAVEWQNRDLASELKPAVASRKSVGRPRSVSAVVPVFNRADCIGRCLDSIAAQTYPVDEIIVVDDASTDRTVAEVRNWMRRHSTKLRLVHQAKNLGGSAARNAGIKAATSEWIAFLDSDDLWHPEKIAKQILALEQADDVTAMVYVGMRFFDDQGHITYTMAPTLHGDLSNALYGQNLLCSSSSFMVRRDLLDRVGGFDEDQPSCQDWDLWLRLSREAHFVAVPEILVDYDDTTRDRISRQHRQRFRGHWKILKNHTKPVAHRHPKAVATLHFTLGDILMMMGRSRSATRFFSSSWRQRPFSPKRAGCFLMARLGFDPEAYAGVKRLMASLKRLAVQRKRGSVVLRKAKQVGPQLWVIDYACDFVLTAHFIA